MVTRKEKNFVVSGIFACAFLITICAAVFLAAPASAVVIDDPDSWTEPIYLKSTDVGDMPFTDEEVWYKLVTKDIHLGYIKTTIKNAGKYVEFSERVFQRLPEAHYLGDSRETVYCEPMSLRPVKHIIWYKVRDSKSSITVDKVIYYDWAKKLIIIDYGKGENARRRTIKMTADFIGYPTSRMLMFNTKLLVHNQEYRYNYFDPNTERFIQQSMKVFRPDTNRDLFEISYGMPTAIGNMLQTKIYVGSRTNKNPNGICYRMSINSAISQYSETQGVEARRSTMKKAYKK